VGVMRCTPIGSARPAASAPVLDVPKSRDPSDAQMVFAVDIRASGDMFVDSTRKVDDAALLEQARQAAQSGDVPAIIRADASVPHGGVIHTLDILKEAGISKIAFGVSPDPPAGR